MKTYKNITESNNPVSTDIDTLKIREILEILSKDSISILDGISNSIESIEEVVKLTVNSLKNNGRLFYVGAGTSGRLGVLDASECYPTFGVSRDRVQGIIAGGKEALWKSIEGAEDDITKVSNIVKHNSISKSDTVIGISCSGIAPFVLEFLKESKSQGSSTALITFNPLNDINYVNCIVRVLVGPEIISGSTRLKGGTATKIILNMITTTTMIKLNKTYGNYMVDLKVMNQKLLERGISIVSSITGIGKKEATKLLDKSNGHVKNAIAMQILHISYIESCKLLDSNDGSLRKVINEHDK